MMILFTLCNFLLEMRAKRTVIIIVHVLDVLKLRLLFLRHLFKGGVLFSGKSKET